MRKSGKSGLATYYQALALFSDQESLAKAYDTLATAFAGKNGYVCEQSAMTKPDACKKAWCQALTDVVFEKPSKAPAEYDKFLTTRCTVTMQLPPENERENRHQIMQIDFGD